MKTGTKLSKAELKQITGGSQISFHYYCICSNGKTMNGSSSSIPDMVEVVSQVCGDDVSGECFMA